MDMSTGTLYIGQARRLWALWIIAHVVGGTLGWMVAALVTIFTLGFGGLIAGGIAGLVIGKGQELVLQQVVSHRRPTPEDQAPALDQVDPGNRLLWSRYSGLGGQFGWLILIIVLYLYGKLYPSGTGWFFDNRPLPLLIAFGAAGIGFGWMQYRSLRNPTSNAWIWIAISFVSLSLAGYAGKLVGSAVYPNSIADSLIMGPTEAVLITVAGIVGSTIYGLLTVPAVTWLSRVA